MKKKISFWIYPLIIMGFAFIISNSCKKNDNSNDNPSSTTANTTLDRTIVPDDVPAIPTVLINDPANFAKYGYGTWHYGPGIPCQKRLDLMPSG